MMGGMERPRAPDAAQRHFSDALQSRGPCLDEMRSLWVPARRRNACALQLVRDTRLHTACGVRISRGKMIAAAMASRQRAAKACSMVTKPPCS